MKIIVVGGGPAGLYFSILMKKQNAAHDITVVERNRAAETFGWGVVFSDETLSFFEENDTETYRAITDSFAHWDKIDLFYKGTKVRSGGHGFSGIERRKLLQILQERATGLGVKMKFETEVDDHETLGSADLVIAADGLNSKIRNRYKEFFQPSLEPRASKYIWLGTRKKFDAFTFIYEENADGIFQVHAYRFDNDSSTFIVETDQQTWKNAKLDTLPEKEQIAYLEKLFEKHLGGEKLLSNKSQWLQFNTLRCKNWIHKNIVLLGDSAHTAHFSIGSGTKLAMESAIELSKALAVHPKLEDAVVQYERERRLNVEKIQAAAQDSLLFFEHTKRYFSFDPLSFSFRLLTRSKKIGYDNLKVRDVGYVDDVTHAFAKNAGAQNADTPPMFTPFSLAGMRLENRVVVSPMCLYSATDGTPNDTHLVHLGSRAVGGAGLIVTEMTNVSADGRISPGCTGMYSPEHIGAWKRITDFVHSSSKAKIALQLGHAGRKGATKLMWEGHDEPLESGAWPIYSASPIPYTPRHQVPKEMSRADMDNVKADFVRATKWAVDAGFDMIELHMAHGYLLASFLSPLTNIRKDEFGGSLENRLRYPLEVLDAVRTAWGKRPLSVRVSATDWHEEGNTVEDAVEISRALKAHGVDIVHASTGQTTPEARPPFYGRMFQTPFADAIRNDVGIPTIAVGNITSADQVNTILAAGRADLVALARPHLRDPYFTFHAAEEAGFADLTWPNMYTTVKVQRRL